MPSVRVALAGILTLCLLNGEVSQAGTIYEAAADFSPTNNPNGVWSYGWSTTSGSAFNLYVTHANIDGLDFWEGPIPPEDSPPLPPYYPLIEHNGTSSTITYGGSVRIQPGQLGMHPGPQDQYSVIRFTTPVAGTYHLAASFTGLDFVGPTTTDVHVLVDGASILSGPVDDFGAGSGPSFTTTLTLVKGDTVDFAVGYGSDGNYYFDNTGISASLSTGVIPEPASLILLSLGLAGLGVFVKAAKC